MKNIDTLIAEIAPDLVRGEMIFFTADQVATFQTQEISPLTDRQVEIMNKVKAKAGG